MSWLSSFVNNNRNFAGNALKNVAPLLALTGLGSIPAGYLLAGGAGALGQGIKKGSNIGDILHAGVDAGSMGSGLQTGAGMLAKSGLAGGQSAALQQMANQGSGMAGLKNAFAPSSQVAGAAPNIGPVGIGGDIGAQYPGQLGDPRMADIAKSAGMGGGPGIQTGMSSLNPAMAPGGINDIPQITAGMGRPVLNDALTRYNPNNPVLGASWYDKLGYNAKDEFMKDPITGLRVAGGIAGLPGDMRKNDAEAKLLQQKAETQGLTAEQLRQQKANMDALRNALTAKYNQ
jgi:hypothetical protein